MNAETHTKTREPYPSCDPSEMPRPTAIKRERRSISFQVEGATLHGMLDLPIRGIARRPLGVLMLNSDDGCRLGPHNLWVRLADVLASDGFPCLRFDYRGCGDSQGPEGPPPGDIGLTDAIAAQQVLRAQAHVDATALVGICYGAEVGLLAARCLPTVRGVVACSTGRYVTPAGYGRSFEEAGRYTRGYLRRLTRADTWRRVLRGDVHPRPILQGLIQRLSRRDRRRDCRGAAAAIARASQGPQSSLQMFIYGGADPLMRRYMPGYRAEAGQAGIDRRFVVIEGADHNFSSASWSRQVIESIRDFVNQLDRRIERESHASF